MDKTEQRLNKLESQMESVWKRLINTSEEPKMFKVYKGEIYKHNIFHKLKITAIESTEKERFECVVISTDESDKTYRLGAITDAWLNNFSKEV
jgi:hypothetical protein